MRLKEFLKETLQHYFILVTLINIATFILGVTLQPDERFGYEAFLSPLIYGFVGLFPQLLSYSQRELTIRQLIVRKIFELMGLEIILIIVGFGRRGITRENMQTILWFAVSVFVIYILVHIITWLLDKKSAENLMKELSEYQRSNGIQSEE